MGYGNFELRFSTAFVHLSVFGGRTITILIRVMLIFVGALVILNMLSCRFHQYFNPILHWVVLSFLSSSYILNINSLIEVYLQIFSHSVGYFFEYFVFPKLLLWCNAIYFPCLQGIFQKAFPCAVVMHCLPYVFLHWSNGFLDLDCWCIVSWFFV